MFKKSFIIAAVIILLQTGTTNAVSLSFEDAGWYSDTGGCPIAVNYFVGDFSTGMPHRNWFVFDLSDIEMTVGSATLRAYNPSNGYSSPDSTETWTLFDVTTDITSLMNNTGGAAAFEDLGSGISYGSIIVSAADNNKFVEVVLNNNALAAINNTSGLFAIGGALTTLSPDTKECVFSTSNINPQIQLVLEPVPEPATIAFLGLGALTLIRRKK